MADRNRGGVRLERAALAVAFLATWLFELVLAERKYAMLGGGFGVSHRLNGPGEVALFLLATGLAQALWVGASYLLFFRLMPKPPARLARLFSFLFFTIGLASAAVVARFELLSYFSDAVSFRLLRNLGGGSLIDAALFGLSEGALIGQALVAALVVYLGGLYLIRRHARGRTGQMVAPAIAGKHLLILAALLPAIAWIANRQPDVRYAANRIGGYTVVRLALDQLTDFDRDGYSWYSSRVDTASFDADRHPLALDIPGNGVDEDGLAGDFRADPAGAPPPLPALPRRPRNLVMIVLESTRGDGIGRRIDGKPVVPVLEALARGGSSAAEAFSHVGFTTASLKSLFSGKLEPRAGDPSLFTDLKAAGYRIAVFSGQPEDFGDISAIVGMRRSSDIFVDAETLKADRAFAFAAQGSLLVDESKLLGAFDRALGNPAGWARPTFVYFNFQSAHFPYHHPGMADAIDRDPLPRAEISAANRGRVARTYWNAVAYSDRMIGQVVARLKALGVWEDTLLLVTADHGESLFEDGFLGHGHIINRIQTHIPLVINAPGIDLTGPIGLSQYREIVIRALAGAGGRRPAKRVFQYIGLLDEPAAIGIVEADGVQTSLDLETEEVWFQDIYRRLPYAKLAAGSALRARADRLVHEWEAQRWAARPTAEPSS